MTPSRRTTVARVGRGAACAAVVWLAVALAGCHPGGGPTPAAPTTRSPEPTTVVSSNPPVRATAQVPVRPAQDVPPSSPPRPVRVAVPSLGIDVPVRATGVDDAGRMALPGSSGVAGWYRFGSAPASPAGATVIAAHVDDEDSVGPFARLAGAETGAAVRVRTADGATHNFTVKDVRAEAKADVSFDDLFDKSGRPRLVLVTCGGEWDAEARSYEDNVVVTAVPQP